MVKQVTAKELMERTGFVLVDFYADWCPPCRMVSPVLEELSEQIEDVEFLKINVDEQRLFSLDRQIRSVPTIILFKDGEELDRKIGFNTKEVFTNWLNGLIK